MNDKYTKMPEDLAQIIRHSLGIDDKRKKIPYRSHFCASVGSKDYGRCLWLEQAGYMKRGQGTDQSVFFFVTEDGAKSVGSTLPDEN